MEKLFFKSLSNVSDDAGQECWLSGERNNDPLSSPCSESLSSQHTDFEQHPEFWMNEVEDSLDTVGYAELANSPVEDAVATALPKQPNNDEDINQDESPNTYSQKTAHKKILKIGAERTKMTEKLKPELDMILDLVEQVLKDNVFKEMGCMFYEYKLMMKDFFKSKRSTNVDAHFGPVGQFKQTASTLPIITPTALDGEDIDNASEFNDNLEGFMQCRSEETAEPNFFDAISIFYRGDEELSSLYRFTTLMEMKGDLEFDKLCKSSKLTAHSAFLKVLDKKEALHPLVVHYVCKLLKRPILLHIGSQGGSQTSLQFGNNFANSKTLHILELDLDFFPLFPLSKYGTKNTMKHPAKTGLLHPVFHQIPPPPVPSSLQSAVETFYSTCNFCTNMSLTSCPHLFPKHAAALQSFKMVLQGKEFGRFTSEDIESDMIDRAIIKYLPKEIVNSFSVIQTPGKGNCMYNSVSYTLTKTFNCQLALRRAMATEFLSNEAFFRDKFAAILPDDKDFSKLAHRIHCTTEWGDSNTLLILSKMLSRKIVVYSHGKPPLLQGYISYYVDSETPSTATPLFLLCRSNIHFQAMIPKPNANIDNILSASVSYVPQPKAVQRLRYDKLRKEKADSSVDIPIIEIDTDIPLSSPKRKRVDEKLFNDGNHSLTSAKKNEELPDLKIQKLENYKDTPINDISSTVENKDFHQNASIIGLPVQSESARYESDIHILTPHTNSCNDEICISDEDAFETHMRNSLITVGSNPDSFVSMIFGDVEKDIVRILDLDKFMALDTTLRKRDSRIFFLNVLKDEIIKMKHGDINNNIDTLVKRTNSQAFWRREVKRLKGITTSNYIKNKINDMKHFQEQHHNRQMTKCALQAFGVPKSAIDIYSVKADEQFGNKAQERNLLRGITKIFERKQGKKMDSFPLYSMLKKPSNKAKPAAAVSERPTLVSANIPGLKYDADSVTEEYNESDVDDDTVQQSMQEDILTRNLLQTRHDYDGHSEPLKSNLVGAKTQSESNYEDCRVENDDTSKTEHLDDSGQSKQCFVSEIITLAKSFNATSEELNYFPPMTFNVMIPSQAVEKMYSFENKSFISGEWASVFDTYLNETQKCCSFSATRQPKVLSGASFAHLSGKCGCGMQFKVEIVDHPVRGADLCCRVVSIGSFKLIQEKPTGRQLKGRAREEMASKLKSEKAGKIMNTSLAQLPILRMLHNNYPQRSINVLQVARHKAKLQKQTKTNEFEAIDAFASEVLELEKESKKVPGYIQEKVYTRGKIYIDMYTETSLKLLSNLSKTETSVLHFDATGSVISKSKNVEKQVLLYLGLVKVGDHTFPLVEALSQSGTAQTISQALSHVKTDMCKITTMTGKPLVSVAVCDFSFAMIHGILRGINCMTLKDYLIASFNTIHHNATFDPERTVMFVCSAHVMHSYSRLLKSHIPQTSNKSIRVVAISSLARFTECLNLKEYMKISETVCKLFNSKYMDPKDAQRYKELLHSKMDETELEEVEEREEFLVDNYNNLYYEQLRMRSPFFHIFRIIKEKAQTVSSAQKSASLNPFFCPKVVDFFSSYGKENQHLIDNQHTSHSGTSSTVQYNTVRENDYIRSNTTLNEVQHEEDDSKTQSAPPSTVLAALYDAHGISDFTLTAKRLAELCSNDIDIDIEQMEFHLESLRLMCSAKFQIVRPHFVVKQLSKEMPIPQHVWTTTRSKALLPEDIIARDHEKLIQQNAIILHALRYVNHWILLAINLTNKECLVYNSSPNVPAYARALAKEIKFEALPKFLPLNQTTHNWTVRSASRFPVQEDSHSCGLYTMEAARQIVLTNNTSCVINKIDDPEHYRFTLARQFLGTTKTGRARVNSRKLVKATTFCLMKSGFIFHQNKTGT